MSGTRKIGLFGGSFDPIHHGHLILARDILEKEGLHRIVFLPSARAPLKERKYLTSDADRLAMVAAAVSGVPQFEVSDEEIQRGGISYSIETARAWKEKAPAAELFWIIGADQAAQLHRWHQIEALLGLVVFLVATRPGFEPSSALLSAGDRVRLISSRTLDLSSTEVRQRCAAKQPIDFLVPEPVSTYIQKHSLYCSFA